jgi:hypothetical protein
LDTFHGKEAKGGYPIRLIARQELTIACEFDQ